MKFFLIVDSVTENWRFGLKFLNSRAGKHGLVDAEKIWFDEAPNERVIDKEIIFLGKVRVIRKEKPDRNFRMMLLNPIDDARVETLKINFWVTVGFEIFLERSEHSSAIEGNIRMLGGF